MGGAESVIHVIHASISIAGSAHKLFYEDFEPRASLVMAFTKLPPELLSDNLPQTTKGRSQRDTPGLQVLGRNSHPTLIRS